MNESDGEEAPSTSLALRIILAEESSLVNSSNSGCSTYGSIHDQETDICKDTSDTVSTNTHSSDVQLEVLEYEVASLTDNRNVYSNDSSTGTNGYFEPVKVPSITERVVETDGYGPQTVYSNCVGCQKQTNSFYRFCRECYRTRKMYLPLRPRKHFNKKRKSDNQTDPLVVRKRQRSESSENTSTSGYLLTSKRTRVESIVSKTVKSMNTDSRDIRDNQKAGKIQSDNFPSCYQCVSCASMTSSISCPNCGYPSNLSANSCQTSSIGYSNFGPDSDKYDKTFNNCIICLSDFKNGAFVHSRFIHICCCYRCALKVWKGRKQCPICKSKIQSVMKLFLN